MQKLIDLYNAHGTLYRLVWTAIQLGAGLVAVRLGADPVIGGLVTAVVVIVTSEARKRLGEV